MNRKLRGTAIRLAIFLTVCGLALFVIMAVFGQARFNNDTKAYIAQFRDVSGLREGNLVRVAVMRIQYSHGSAQCFSHPLFRLRST